MERTNKTISDFYNIELSIDSNINRFRNENIKKEYETLKINDFDDLISNETVNILTKGIIKSIAFKIFHNSKGEVVGNPNFESAYNIIKNGYVGDPIFEDLKQVVSTCLWYNSETIKNLIKIKDTFDKWFLFVSVDDVIWNVHPKTFDNVVSKSDCVYLALYASVRNYLYNNKTKLETVSNDGFKSDRLYLETDDGVSKIDSYAYNQYLINKNFNDVVSILNRIYNDLCKTFDKENNDKISARLKETLLLMFLGKKQSEISKKLKVSIRTTKSDIAYIKNVYLDYRFIDKCSGNIDHKFAEKPIKSDKVYIDFRTIDKTLLLKTFLVSYDGVNYSNDTTDTSFNHTIKEGNFETTFNNNNNNLSYYTKTIDHLITRSKYEETVRFLTKKKYPNHNMRTTKSYIRWLWEDYYNNIN